MVLMLAITTVAALMLLPGFASQDEAGTPAAGADYIAAREAEEQRRREEDERFAAACLLCLCKDPDAVQTILQVSNPLNMMSGGHSGLHA